jgi:hypothetical protein
MISTPMLLKRLIKQTTAWSEMADQDQFAGMTLADFRGVVSELESAVANMDKINALARAGIKARSDAEKKAMKMSKRLTMAIKSHPNHGEDSQLLRATGFKPESEIRSGRKPASSSVEEDTTGATVLQ